ncbi:MAG TPA: hypothetical protein VLB87_01815 [Pyrinomonadaceae bacterium]|nr:hypothetical protein [Pyrinomonadaceae bacterium]
MKNIKQNVGDSLRPEYKHADFGEMVRGKYAVTQVEFAELVRLLIACIGEEEGLTFLHHLPGNQLAGRKQGDWTYEFDNANKVTLRYWLSEYNSLEEPISNPPCVMTNEAGSELQALLLNHVRALKARVEEL